jgi:hypothetical protein
MTQDRKSQSLAALRADAAIFAERGVGGDEEAQYIKYMHAQAQAQAKSMGRDDISVNTETSVGSSPHRIKGIELEINRRKAEARPPGDERTRASGAIECD